MNTQEFIIPQWPCPENIVCLQTRRFFPGGHSLPPYDNFNLALHVNDNPAWVEKNRGLLQRYLPARPFWLEQIHSSRIIACQSDILGKKVSADGSYATRANQICAIMSADCLPVLFCFEDGCMVGAAHAGWRGLAAGVLQALIRQMCACSGHKSTKLMAWLGPAISQVHFEVGESVCQAFVTQHKDYAQAFVPAANARKYQADLYQLARITLRQCGVTRIYGGEFCTYAQTRDFFSYRRDGTRSGRMATLIWISED